MFDKVIKMNKSIIQHGKFNDRIYLMKLKSEDKNSVLDKINDLENRYNYGKIFTKVSKEDSEIFLKKGYEEEAQIPNFYNGKDDCVFLSKFLSKKRKNINGEIKERLDKVLEVCDEKKILKKQTEIQEKFKYKILDKNDAKQLTELYKVVFASYPFPIYDENYLKETMDDNLIYFGIFYNGKLVSASSAEMDFKGQNVEMTDFATLPDFRGNSFATFLLFKMEKEVVKKGIKTFFTIARGVSFGMNITFAKLGYKFAGRLVNNTNISGNIENMNVWYKR
ncbi:MAG: putative beta-lysine N-acetyltransferase [Candidatus Marinimicrobia bacterium]|nr:putative beta-lysine N-acetyltransferase [Candidatus Neomarinimicrobiota bacterium]